MRLCPAEYRTRHTPYPGSRAGADRAPILQKAMIARAGLGISGRSTLRFAAFLSAGPPLRELIRAAAPERGRVQTPQNSRNARAPCARSFAKHDPE